MKYIKSVLAIAIAICMTSLLTVNLTAAELPQQCEIEQVQLDDSEALDLAVNSPVPKQVLDRREITKIKTMTNYQLKNIRSVVTASNLPSEVGWRQAA